MMATQYFQELSTKLEDFARTLEYPSAENFKAQQQSSVDNAL